MPRKAFATGLVVMAFFICAPAFSWDGTYDWTNSITIYDYRQANPGSFPIDTPSINSSLLYPNAMQSDLYPQSPSILNPQTQPSLNSAESLLEGLEMKSRERRFQNGHELLLK